MSARIHVGLVAPTPAMPGGHAVQARRLIEAWAGDPDIHVRLVPINPAPPHSLAWASRIKFVRTAVTQCSYWPLLLRELRRADVVHVFATSNSSFFVSAFPAIMVARWWGKPVVVNYRGDGREHLAGSATVRRALKAIELNVVPSAYFHGVFHELGIPAQVIPNVADLARFHYHERDPIRPRLVSTRHFEPIYDVACTVRAFARVQARYPEASLVLVGSGSVERALRALVDDLGLRQVRFAGCVPQTDIARYYDDADIYVQTPTIDNMPGSVIEAFASGLPVVSTAVGGVPVILKHGEHGLLAPAGDDAGVAAQVMSILEGQAAARRMAAAAAATCQAYDQPIVREQWRTVYRQLTGELIAEVA